MVEEINTEKPSDAPTMVKSAYDAAQVLKVENERMEKNIKQMQEMQSFQLLGGRSNGAPQQEIKKEETPHEYHERIKKELREGKYSSNKKNEEN